MLLGYISVWFLKLLYQSVKLLVKLPQNSDEMREKESQFEITFGMIQAFGCIDCTHIPIKQPLTNSQDYFNYKHFFSLNVKAICDSQGSFMDVEYK